jgi:hypothetical protein
VCSFHEFVRFKGGGQDKSYAKSIQTAGLNVLRKEGRISQKKYLLSWGIVLKVVIQDQVDIGHVQLVDDEIRVFVRRTRSDLVGQQKLCSKSLAQVVKYIQVDLMV